MFDVSVLRRQFPALSNDLVYLDSAATTQKPNVVLQSMDAWYRQGAASPNRGVYPLATTATEQYEHARSTIAKFLNAAPHEIIFTKGTTESINLVARSFGEMLQSGDRIALTVMEHHSNIVPWQQLSKRSGGGIDWILVDEEGQPNLDELKKVLEKGNTKLVAITGLSNVLGSVVDCKKVTTLAHNHGALMLIDAAQMAAHAPIDVRDLDCDFLAFSGHKLYGPMGIGVLYGKEEYLDRIPPFLGGGDMIQSVTRDGFIAADIPRKFEAGTVSTADAIGLGFAIEWMKSMDWKGMMNHEAELMAHAISQLQSIDGLKILGTQNPKKRIGCISFIVEHIHPHDLTELLGQKNICLRAGHHCTQPLHTHLGINASARMSFGLYNTKEDIDLCSEETKTAIKLLANR